MTSKAPHRVSDDVAADPWWGEPQPTLADPLAPAAARPRRRRAPRRRTGIGWRILRLLATPFVVGGRRLRESPRVRRMALRLVVAVFVVTFLACSVGVILINNVVIGRTAELGELDDRRRELRRENALLGAEAARLSAPLVVFRRAERDLGMVRTSELPQFIYLDPHSRTLTPFQRARVAAAAQRRRDLLERRGEAQSPGDGGGRATVTTSPGATTGRSATTTAAAPPAAAASGEQPADASQGAGSE